jgi:hypothetical protein
LLYRGRGAGGKGGDAYPGGRVANVDKVRGEGTKTYFEEILRFLVYFKILISITLLSFNPMSIYISGRWVQISLGVALQMTATAL